MPWPVVRTWTVGALAEVVCAGGGVSVQLPRAIAVSAINAVLANFIGLSLAACETCGAHMLQLRCSLRLAPCALRLHLAWQR
ncbi:hypothetical protein DGM85_00090 [Xanthomonas phaseoli pv. phaseoli]|nr:hypothetical protein DGM85_00090 [Xanthomonas phaseoli pv. phaseoli]